MKQFSHLNTNWLFDIKQLLKCDNGSVAVSLSLLFRNAY